MDVALRLIVIIAGYAIGSIPIGLIIAKRFYGVDVRERGSGNIGATNVWRTVGPRAGLLVLVLDILKGALPSSAMLSITGSEMWAALAGIGALVGHSLSPFLRFRGGKSVATGLGLLIGVVPDVAGIVVLVFAVTLALTRYVSLSSILGCIAVIISLFALHHELMPSMLMSAAAGLIIFRHRANIVRLANGTEPRFGRRSATKGS